MADPFRNREPSLNGPARDALPVTPSDAQDLSVTALALYVETGGTLSVITAAGQTRTLVVPDFTFLPVRIRRVRASGTTASGIHALVIG